MKTTPVLNTASDRRADRKTRPTILEALLGAETLARLRSRAGDGAESAARDVRAAAGHRPASRAAARGGDTAAPAPVAHRHRARPDDLGGHVDRASELSRRVAGAGERAAPVALRIAQHADLADLAREHPAVIAHILARVDRKDRIAMLRQLPGHAARAALRRLQTD
jgi:hypothetical protein